MYRFSIYRFHFPCSHKFVYVRVKLLFSSTIRFKCYCTLHWKVERRKMLKYCKSKQTNEEMNERARQQASKQAGKRVIHWKGSAEKFKELFQLFYSCDILPIHIIHYDFYDYESTWNVQEKEKKIFSTSHDYCKSRQTFLSCSANISSSFCCSLIFTDEIRKQITLKEKN